MEQKITVVHATAPGCHWSWGNEANVNRLKMVYGDQIDLVIRLGCPYDSWEQWLKDYEMTDEEAVKWMNEEAIPTMGVPIAPMTVGGAPRTVLPPSLAVLASLRFAPEKAHRFNRELLRQYAVEGKDIGRWSVIEGAARAVGIDSTRLKKEMDDEEGLQGELAEEGRKGPPVHVGFYNWVVWDGGNRRVVLDYAFEPAELEGAIDYLSNGKLAKAKPADVHAYLREHGWAPLAEVRRAFALTEDAARRELETLEKAGRAERGVLAGAPHWRATG